MSTKESVRTNLKVRIEPPKSYRVIVLNDDVTPMDIVTLILIGIFNKNAEEALELTLKAHNNGSAAVGVYTYDIAKSKVRTAKKLAKKSGFDLGFKIEEA